MSPAAAVTIAQLANFDDEALRTFLDPADGGIDPADLAIALSGCADDLAHRVAAALPADALGAWTQAREQESGPAAVAAARACVLDRLFWPLVYWNAPDDYEELVAGEAIHPRLLDMLAIDGAVVCDMGAGSGRFTLYAASRARTVIAVDAVPALLDRLRRKASAAGLTNIDIRRGSFAALPVASGSVDVVVACSSITSTPPHGGRRALAEAERIVRPGGDIAVIWPQDPEWLRAAGFAYVKVPGEGVLHFRDVATAIRLCRTYYSDNAAQWVRSTQRADVPYAVLGVSPPHDLCVKRAPDEVTPGRAEPFDTLPHRHG